ncbi:enoyl-CoA hydratase/isomerase family protein [Aeromicrobium marinum DSM 15272]|uniref:Enoyl-CoA hydratase/isomerase family protein n=1 Tax=Aeromicrobium marinum DSM 15272 TaxID=585531 RepID=E2SDB1_9ACTN|nr:enoyl-CoA hydratase [Aeromicrobium marinum]EFQ82488.1 enoyl-CoA hydratase/isomerase family protein [Aeromicrobium marinum DSM 15272]
MSTQHGTRTGTEVEAVLDAGVLTVTIRRPDSLNSVNDQVLHDLADLVEGAASHADARVVVLRGEGRAFSSGADLDPDEQAGDPSTATIDAANRLVGVIRDSRLPVVSVVQGPCAGVGVPIALAADLTVASSAAFFMLAFTKIGLMPDGGASALVAASVGRATAMRMALLAERLSATDAKAAGLVAAVHDPEVFDAEVRAVLDHLVAGPPAAYARTKQAINSATLGALDAAFELERDGQMVLLGADDFAEGAAAFREKRTPTFSDR